MTPINYLVILVYILLILANYIAFKKGKEIHILTFLTAVLATILLFSSNTARLDWSETGLDMSGYRTLYEQYDVLDHPDFKMYYIFYGLMHLGQSLGVSFYAWWGIMSVLGMLVIAIACKVHGFSYPLFLASFMAYYEFVFYSGFKFFYGFCFFLLAYGFLLTEERYSRLKYVLVLLIAGGFHPMYYFFLLFLLTPKRNPKFFVSAIAIGALILTIFARLSGSAASILAPFFNMLDNEHIDKYIDLTVHWGFYLPIFLQIVIVYIAAKMRKFRETRGLPERTTETLYYTTILSLVFCPFYALALTFMRLQTAFSLVIVSANSIHVNDLEGKALCSRMSLLMVLAYWFNNIISGLRGFIGNSVIPFFDVF